MAIGQTVKLPRIERAPGIDYVILTDINGKQTYVHKDSMGLDATTDDQNLTIGGSGPTYTIDIETGSDVTIAAGGINALSEGTPNILTITATEIDGSITNEIQQIDTFTLLYDSLRLSLSSDAVPYKAVDLSPYLDNTDQQGLTITGSGPTYVVDINGGSDVTIAASGITTLSEGTANVLTFTTTEVDGSVTNEIQNVDTLVLTGTTLGISLSSDGIPQKTVDLSSLQDGVGVTGSGTAGRITYWNTTSTIASDIWELTSAHIRGSGTGWPEIKNGQYSFRGDDNTGYRWSEADVLGMHAGDDTNPAIEIFGDPINTIAFDADNNGAAEWVFGGTSQSNTAATGNSKIVYSGSSAPQFTFNADEDSGLRRSAADVVGIHAGDATNPLIKADGPGVAVTFDPDDDGVAEVTINATTTTTELLDIGAYGTTATKIAGLNSSGVVTEVTLSGLTLSGDVLSDPNHYAELTFNGDKALTATTPTVVDWASAIDTMETSGLETNAAGDEINPAMTGRVMVTFSGTVKTDGTTFSGIVSFYIYKNGVYQNKSVTAGPFATDQNIPISYTTLLYVTPNDEIEIWYDLSTAGTTYLQIPTFTVTQID